MLPRTALHAAILGSFDGLTSVLGVLLAATLAGASGHLVFLVALGGAVAATVSMAGGEFLAATGRPFPEKFANGLAMGLATFIGSVFPVVPYALWSGHLALISSLVLSLLLAGAIAETRTRSGGTARWRTYLETAWVLCGAGAAVVVITHLVGGGAL